MTVAQLCESCNLTPAFPLPDPDREVACGFCGDAVASLADAAVIILCHDAVLMEDAAARAAERGINIALTSAPEFETAAAVAKLLGL